MSATPTASVKSAHRGAFITFEGVDGCGKTTQAGLLAQTLRGAGLTVLETREPGGTKVGRGLRDVLLDPEHRELVPECELLLFLADRVQHLGELILPALARGETVISDRFHDSTEAYQRFGRELDFSGVEGVIAKHIATHPPSLTFWLEVDLELAQGRIKERQIGDKVRDGERLGRDAGSGSSAQEKSPESRLENEALNFQLRVQKGYETLLREHPRRIVRLDASLPIAELAGEVRKIVKERLNVL